MMLQRVWMSVALVVMVAMQPLTAQVSFDPGAFTFEAEDFNFDGGSYIDSPSLCEDIFYSYPPANASCYWNRIGVTNIDKLELNGIPAEHELPSVNEVYRFGDPSEFGRNATTTVPVEFVDTWLTDDSLVRTQYTAAGVADYEVQSVVAGEWLNYTRTFPAGNYNIYLRAASAGLVSAELHKVTGATGTSQALTYAGQFRTATAPAGYEFIPLTDFGGNLITLSFPGGSAETLRVTARSADLEPNFYMFVASTNGGNLPPTVTITNPANNAVLTEGVAVSIGATVSDPETSVTNVQFYAGIAEPLTLIGETNSGAYTISWTPPVLGSQNTYTIRVLAADTGGIVGGDEIQVTVKDPSIQTVSTAVGNGADAEMREQADAGVTYGGSSYRYVGARTTADSAGVNEIIALRFDLSGYVAAALDNVKLKLTCARDDGSTRDLTLYGVTDGTVSLSGTNTTANWNEDTLDQWIDMPGLQAADGDYSTQNLDPATTTALDSWASKLTNGTIKTFESTELTQFVQSHSGSNQVTFLLAFSPNYRSTGKAQFATKESDVLEGGFPSGAEGDFAPYLEFKELPSVPPTVTITSPLAGATLAGGTEVAIDVDAVDSDGSVTNVDFYAGVGEPLAYLGSDNTAPYSLPWTPVAENPVNNYTIRAIATDDTGSSGIDEIAVTVVEPTLTSVSTADGDGQDVEMVEQNNPTAARNDVNMNTRFNVSNRNEVAGLRFDLSSKPLPNLGDIALNLIHYRTDGSTRVIDIYGVTQGASGGSGNFTTETWTDTSVALWGDLPGLLTSDGDITTMSIDTANLTLLVDNYTMTGITEGAVEQISSAALSSFIQGYTGSGKITFLIVAGNTSGGQFRFCSKEATSTATGVLTGAAGELAPYLSFTELPSAPPEVTLTAPVNGATLDGGVEVTVSATASDSDGSVTNVAFYAGTSEPLTLIGMDNSAPYSVSWTPVAVNPVNLYTIRAVASDNAGITAEDAINVIVVDPVLETVSTAAGNGADTEMREQNDPSSARNTATDLNARFNGVDRNEVIGLKFDLSAYTLSELGSVAVNLVNYRTNSANRIDVYGVTAGASGGTGAYTTETWTDAGGAVVQAWGDLPGLLATDGNIATTSLDTGNLTLLVGDYEMQNLNEGSVETLTSAALTSFVQGYAGSGLLTFIVTPASGYTANSQSRFSSKEATQTESGVLTGSAGDLAPYLSFTVGVVAPPDLNFVITGGGAGIDFSWSGAFKLQAQTNSVATGLTTTWSDVPGGGVSPVSVSVDPANDTVFYRLAPQ